MKVSDSRKELKSRQPKRPLLTFFVSSLPWPLCGLELRLPVACPEPGFVNGTFAGAHCGSRVWLGCRWPW